MTETVDLQIDDGVARITLDRPDVRNALTADMAAALATAFERVEGEETAGVRCVELTGTGDAFCAGGDIDAMVEGQSRDVPPAERVELVRRSVNRAVRAVWNCPLPVVATVDGPVFGAGVGLMLACDVQLASTAATVSVGFRRVGLAVDSGVSYLLPRYVGQSTAKELVFTGEVLDADRARELGLFTRLFDDGEFEEGKQSIVETIASGPTTALSFSKQLLNQEAGSLEEALESEASYQALAMETDDHAEGATAFLERRDPEFSGE